MKQIRRHGQISVQTICFVMLVVASMLLVSCTVTLRPTDPNGSDTTKGTDADPSGDTKDSSDDTSVPGGDTSAKEQDPVAADYKERFKKVLVAVPHCCYFVYDMDQDGTPELFIVNPDTSASDIYQLQDDGSEESAIVLVGSIGFEETGMDLCACADGGVYAEVYKMDTPTHVYRFTLENDGIETEKIYGEMEYGRALSDAMQTDGARMFELFVATSETGLDPDTDAGAVKPATLEKRLDELAKYFHVGTRQSGRFVDDEYFVTDKTRDTIQEMLDYYTTATGIDFNIEILPHLDGDGAFGHIEWRYEYDKLGVGENNTGFILLLDEDEKMLYFETFGDAFMTEDQINATFDMVGSDPFEDGYLSYFSTFVQYVYGCASENDWEHEAISS